MYRGAQVAVTSMGPVECATRSLTPPEGATSVFTSLYSYARLVNATIYDTEAEISLTQCYAARRAARGRKSDVKIVIMHTRQIGFLRRARLRVDTPCVNIHI